MNRKFVMLFMSVTALLSWDASASFSTADMVVLVSNRTELVTALSNATPGTTIQIAPGTYRGGLSRAGLRGTPEKPIIIKAADLMNPPVIEGGPSGLHLSSPEYLEIRNLVFARADGNGMNIDDGSSKETPAHHIKLIGVTVRGVAPRGNRDGMKLSGVDDFQIENCVVEHWGTSGSAIDMVGCHQGTIVGCTFRHEGADMANGVQTKGGSSQVTIRECRFENAGGRAVNLGGSTGLEYFRPKPQGYEAKEITVEDCTFIGSMVPIAFVGVDGAIVRYNTIYRPTRWVIRILQETQAPDFVPCRNGRFEFNLIAFRSNEVGAVVSAGPGTAPETFKFANNVWCCLDRPSSTQNLVRLPVAEQNGRYGVAPDFMDADKGDLRVRNPDGIHAGRRDVK